MHPTINVFTLILPQSMNLAYINDQAKLSGFDCFL